MYVRMYVCMHVYIYMNTFIQMLYSKAHAQLQSSKIHWLPTENSGPGVFRQVVDFGLSDARLHPEAVNNCLTLNPKPSQRGCSPQSALYVTQSFLTRILA